MPPSSRGARSTAWARSAETTALVWASSDRPSNFAPVADCARTLNDRIATPRQRQHRKYHQRDHHFDQREALLRSRFHWRKSGRCRNRYLRRGGRRPPDHRLPPDHRSPAVADRDVDPDDPRAPGRRHRTGPAPDAAAIGFPPRSTALVSAPPHRSPSRSRHCARRACPVAYHRRSPRRGSSRFPSGSAPSPPD